MTAQILSNDIQNDKNINETEKTQENALNEPQTQNQKISNEKEQEMTSQHAINEEFGTGWDADELQTLMDIQAQKEADREAVKGLSPEQTQQITQDLQENNEKFQEIVKEKELSDKEFNELLEKGDINNQNVRDTLDTYNELEETKQEIKALQAQMEQAKNQEQSQENQETPQQNAKIDIDIKKTEETIDKIHENEKVDTALKINEELELTREMMKETQKNYDEELQKDLENEPKQAKEDEKDKSKEEPEKAPKTQNQENTQEQAQEQKRDEKGNTQGYTAMMKEKQLEHESKMNALREKEKELQQQLDKSINNIIQSEHDLISLFKALQEVDKAIAGIIGNKQEQLLEKERNRQEQFRLALQNSNVNALGGFGKEMLEELAKGEKELKRLMEEQKQQDKDRFEYITKEMDKLKQDPNDKNTLANIEKFVKENSFKKDPLTNKLETTNFAKTYPQVLNEAKKLAENVRKQEQTNSKER